MHWDSGLCVCLSWSKGAFTGEWVCSESSLKGSYYVFLHHACSRQHSAEHKMRMMILCQIDTWLADSCLCQLQRLSSECSAWNDFSFLGSCPRITLAGLCCSQLWHWICVAKVNSTAQHCPTVLVLFLNSSCLKKVILELLACYFDLFASWTQRCMHRASPLLF